MHNDVYYNGQYYDRTMSEEKKAEILATDERLYVRLFGHLPKSIAEKVEVKQPAKPKK